LVREVRVRSEAPEKIFVEKTGRGGKERCEAEVSQFGADANLVRAMVRRVSPA